MRASRVLAVTATACAAMAFSAPLASAHSGPVNVQANPYSVHQGSTIRITVDGCGRGGLVTSNAFPQTRLSQNPSGHSGATARILDRATPGTYNLAVRCNDSNRVATRQFDVVSGRGALGGLGASAGPALGGRGSVGPALGGLGGSVGPSSAETAVGAGLVATAAIGGTIFVARRRRTLGAV